MFIVSLPSIFNSSNHMKCVSLSNEKCEIQSTVINLHPSEYSQELHYYLLSVKLDRLLEVAVLLMSCLIKYVFNLIAGKNESKILTKDISWEYKYKFNGRKCNSVQKWNNDKCRCECKKHIYVNPDYIWNPATFSYENGKYLASNMDDSTIKCDEIIEEPKTVPTNFYEK